MKTLTLLCLITILLIGCSTEKTEKKGEIVIVPSDLNLSVEQYFSLRKYKLIGLSVREYPNNIFLVSAEIQNSDTNTNAGSKNSNQLLIAQKGIKPDNSPYWNLMPGNKFNLETYGIRDKTIQIQNSDQ